MPIPLSQGCIVQVAIPQEFENLYKNLTQVHTYGMFGSYRELPFTVKDNNMVEIRDACPNYLDNTIKATLKLSSLRNPASVKATGSFTVKILDAQRSLLVETEGTSLVIPAETFKPGGLEVL